MLEISIGKLVRVIMLSREYGPDSPHLTDYIGEMNVDEQISLVAVMWIGRESFEAEDLQEALDTARQEATAPTEEYLSGIPELGDLIEAGMEALDIDVTEAEGGLVSTLMGIPGTPSINLTVKGDAPLDDFTADITLDTDGERRIGGTVTVEVKVDVDQQARISVIDTGDGRPWSSSYGNISGRL